MNDYDRIAKAINYITQHVVTQPSLEEIAAEVSLSSFHFQRLFSKWAGISPKRFLQALTVQHAKTLINESASLLDVSYELGLSSPARLHDHFISLEAVTPGERKSQGVGLEINYGVHETPFGPALVAATERGICKLAFLDDKSDRALLELKQDWPEACIEKDDEKTEHVINSLFSKKATVQKPISLYVKGTNFQINVWRALTQIQTGQLCSYGQLSKLINKPNAARAVGSAVGANPIAFIIPCHRVIRATGVIGDYRWGQTRKRAMIAWETAPKINS